MAGPKGWPLIMHRVHMRFERIFDRWAVTFVNLDSREMLHHYTFDDEWKVEQIAKGTDALVDELGAIVFSEAPEQHKKLKREATLRMTRELSIGSVNPETYRFAAREAKKAKST